MSRVRISSSAPRESTVSSCYADEPPLHTVSSPCEAAVHHLHMMKRRTAALTWHVTIVDSGTKVTIEVSRSCHVPRSLDRSVLPPARARPPCRGTARRTRRRSPADHRDYHRDYHGAHHRSRPGTAA